MSAAAGSDAAVRIIAMNTALPPMVIPYPQCGHCGEDVTIDDGVAWCEGCRITWDRIQDGEIAVADHNREGTAVPCGISVGKADPPHDDTRGNHYVPGAPKPCILPSGHENHHICPYDVTITRAAEVTP